MSVGGGRGRFVVSTQTGRESRHGIAANLMNPTGGDEVGEGVVVGGCQTNLPEKYIVDLSMVLNAVERFFHDGELDPTLEWEPY